MKQRSVWHRMVWAVSLCAAPAMWGFAADPRDNTVAAAERSVAQKSAPPPRAATTFTGTVVAVLDGDTLGVVRNDATELIDLYGVDCPELGQPYGAEARRFTSDLTLRCPVTVSLGNDKGAAAGAGNARSIARNERGGASRVPGVPAQGEVCAEITLPDGTMLNRALLEAGLGWWNSKDPGEQDWKLERPCAEARAAKRGLWADTAPVAPWDFRARAAALAADKQKGEGVPDPGIASQQGVFITRGGRQYHQYGCRYLDQSQKVLARSEAVKRGYQPCLLCFPETLNLKGQRELRLQGMVTAEAEIPAAPPVAEAPPPPDLQPPRAEILPPPDDDLMSLMARHRPRLVRDDNGEVIGITADDISALPYADLLGLEDGDVVQMVNGVWIDSIDTALALADDLQGATEFEVVVLRDDGPHTLYFSMP